MTVRLIFTSSIISKEIKQAMNEREIIYEDAGDNIDVYLINEQDLNLLRLTSERKFINCYSNQNSYYVT